MQDSNRLLRAGDLLRLPPTLREVPPLRQKQEATVKTLEQARAIPLLGWNIRCNLCGDYGASWHPGERPGWGSLALCETHGAQLRAENRRHAETVQKLRVINFENYERAEVVRSRRRAR